MANKDIRKAKVIFAPHPGWKDFLLLVFLAIVVGLTVILMPRMEFGAPLSTGLKADTGTNSGPNELTTNGAATSK
jgi:hypothetical protein